MQAQTHTHVHKFKRLHTSVRVLARAWMHAHVHIRQLRIHSAWYQWTQVAEDGACWSWDASGCCRGGGSQKEKSDLDIFPHHLMATTPPPIRGDCEWVHRCAFPFPQGDSLGVVFGCERVSDGLSRLCELESGLVLERILFFHSQVAAISTKKAQ